MRALMKWLKGSSKVQISVLGAMLVAAVALAELQWPQRLAYTSMFLLLSGAVGWFGGIVPAVITAAAAAGYMWGDVWENSSDTDFQYSDWVNFILRWGSCATVGYLAAALRKAQRELEARVSQRTTQLQKTVSELEETMHQLRESQDRFAEMADNIHEVFWSVDARWQQVFYVSRGYERIWGRSCESLYQSPRSWVDAVHPEDRERLNLQQAEILPLTEEGAEEFRISRPDGTEVWLRSRAFPIRDKNGETVRFAGFTEDITRARMAQRALELQAMVLQTMAEGVVLLGPDRKIILTNPALEACFGCDSGELIGQDIAVLSGSTEAETARILEDIDQSVSDTGCWSGDVLNRRKDGSSFTSQARVCELKMDGRSYKVSVQEDITERKQAEAELKRSEALLSQTQRLAHVGGWEWDVQRQAGFWTEETFRIHDMEPHEAELWPDDLSRAIACYGLEARESIMNAFQRCMTSGDACDLELPFVSSKGRRMWVRALASPVLEDGKVVRFIGSIMDVTDRKKAEEAIRDSEEKYRVLFSDSTDAYMIIAGMRFIECNRAAEAMLHGGRQWIIGLSMAAISPPYQPDGRSSAKAAEEIVAQAFASGSHRFEWVHRRFDGQDFWAEISTTATTVQGRAVLFTTLREITDRKRAEEAVLQANLRLEEARAFYHSILESIKSGVWVSTPEDTISYTNKALANISDASADRPPDFQQLSAGDLAPYYHAARRSLQPVAYDAVPVPTPGKRLIYQSGWFVPRLANGAYAGMICTVEDVTERMEAELLAQIQRDLVVDLSSLDNLQEAVERLLHAATNIDWIECGGVYLINSVSGDLELITHSGISPEFAVFVSRPAKDSPEARMIQDGNPLYGKPSDFGDAIEKGLLAEGMKFFALCPLRDGNEVIGCLIAASKSRSEITPALRAFLEGIVVQAGGAIARIREQEARRQSEIRLRAIINNAPIALLAVNSKGRVAFSDGSALRAINEVPNQYNDLPLAETSLCQRAPAILEHSRRALAGEAFTTFLALGAETFEISYSPHHDRAGSQDGFIAVAKNVTDRIRLERDLLETTEREQARIGQDLHDDLCQQLVSIAFDINSLADSLAVRSTPHAARARRIVSYVDSALTQARRFARGLFPVKLEANGLASALQQLADSIASRHPIELTFEMPEQVQIPDNTVATHLFRIAQEALTNVIRHAKATHVRIMLSQEDHKIELTITDNGCGLPSHAKGASGMGRHIMEYRSRSFGGTLQIRPAEGGGTVVYCCVPLPIA